jgi:hypothetical protein
VAARRPRGSRRVEASPPPSPFARHPDGREQQQAQAGLDDVHGVRALGDP